MYAAIIGEIASVLRRHDLRNVEIYIASTSDGYLTVGRISLDFPRPGDLARAEKAVREINELRYGLGPEALEVRFVDYRPFRAWVRRGMAVSEIVL